MAESKCKQCREPIDAGAKLCRSCHSYQDWRGYLPVSSSVLALLVALVTVATAAIPVLTKALHRPHSRVVVSSPVVQGETVYFAVSNIGDAAGVVRRAGIEAPEFEVNNPMTFLQPHQVLIRPGTQQLAVSPAIMMSSGEAAEASLGGLKSNARPSFITVAVEQASGEIEEFRFPLSSSDMREMLVAHAERCDGVGQKKPWPSDCFGLVDLRKENDRLHKIIQGKLHDAAEHTD